VKCNLKFREIIDKIGTPLISNKIGDCSLCVPNYPEGIEIGNFLAIGQIISLFETGKFSCGLKLICEKVGNSIDNRCLNSPWKHTKEYPLLCPYALFWKHWNFDGIVPTQ